MRKFLVIAYTTLSLLFIHGCSKADTNVDFTSQEAVIIDVRTVDEFNSGHLSRAERVDWQTIQVAAMEMNLNKDQPILLYCRSGSRAGKAQGLLKKMGFTNVHNLGGVSDASRLTKDIIIR